MTKLTTPHGGVLKPLLLQNEKLNTEKEKAQSLPIIKMTSRETSDLIMMAIGAFSPLDGFRCKKDYDNVVSNIHLAIGLVWHTDYFISYR